MATDPKWNGDAFYRYWLERDLLVGTGRMTFVMLNPSTADDLQDDPTIRRCIGFAKREGFRSLSVVNLFAERTTNPKHLYIVKGQANDPSVGVTGAWHRAFLENGSKVVAAWGSGGGRPWLRRMIETRVEMLVEVSKVYGRQLHCLGVTKTGAPRHPLYVKANAKLEPWRLGEREVV